MPQFVLWRIYRLRASNASIRNVMSIQASTNASIHNVMSIQASTNASIRNVMHVHASTNASIRTVKNIHDSANACLLKSYNEPTLREQHFLFSLQIHCWARQNHASICIQNPAGSQKLPGEYIQQIWWQYTSFNSVEKIRIWAASEVRPWPGDWVNRYWTEIRYAASLNTLLEGGGNNFSKINIIVIINRVRHFYGNAHFIKFLNKKKQRNWKFMRLALANDTITIIKSIYSIWPPLFLMTDFNLPWNASQEARCSTSWGIRAHSRCRVQEGSNPGSLRAIHLC